ncbi:MAG: hypothetical protein K0U98_14770 [Deltaproteobacteria bacterium]|nr:hypothetical protein [Deltaproteobacteria bacterium]
MKLKLLLVAKASSRLQKARQHLISIPSLRIDETEEVEKALELIESDPPDILVLDSQDLTVAALELLTVIDALKLPTRLLLLVEQNLGKDFAAPFSIQLCQKPISANALLEILDHTLALREAESLTREHGVADYLLFTALGHCSVALQCSLNSGDALFEVIDGELWSAFYDDQTGVSATRSAIRSSLQSTTARQVNRRPEERQIQEETLELLAAALSEKLAAAGEAQAAPKELQNLGTLPIEIAAAPQIDTREIPPAGEEAAPSTDSDAFTSHFSLGVQEALLRNYKSAAEAFGEALHLRPRDPNTRFNLERLRQLLEEKDS